MKKMYLRKDKETMIMAEKIKCEYCEKDAIGFQSFEGAFACVCQDHADGLLLALRPGEKKSFGVCYFERYDTSDTRSFP
jgi:hypothetical protein